MFKSLALIGLTSTVQAGFPGCVSVPYNASFMDRVYQSQCIWQSVPKDSNKEITLAVAQKMIATYKSSTSEAEQPMTAAEILKLCQKSSTTGTSWNFLQWVACYENIKGSENPYTLSDAEKAALAKVES